MSLKNKLNRMKSHMSLEATPVINHAGVAQRLDVPFSEKWAELEAKPFGQADEYIMIRERRYPLGFKHGKYRFGEFHEVIQAWNNMATNHPLSLAKRKANELLFFDTETTGLHGGVGNTIFLLGHSRVESDAVVVRQHFLAAPHAEVTLYQSFLQEVQETTHLVTFNGKSFDWPQVKTRHTMVRDEVPELPTFGHYDLLHGARRLWKDELPSCRLSILEQVKLGIRRKDDVPGHMAPLLYFDYLNEKDPASIEGVLVHNELDVLSLITLYIHISKLLLDRDMEDLSMEERFEIARWYEAIGEDECARLIFQQISETTHSLQYKAKVALGHLYKKQKNLPSALHMWESAIQETGYQSEEVFIELAKIYEHHHKDYEVALHYTQKALEQWKKKGRLIRYTSQTEIRSFQKRITRLENKLDRQN